jgi:hypothetical protein
MSKGTIEFEHNGKTRTATLDAEGWHGEEEIVDILEGVFPLMETVVGDPVIRTLREAASGLKGKVVLEEMDESEPGTVY